MSIASFAFLARFITIFAAGQNFNAGMLKLKQGIFEGVDNRFSMVFSVFIDIILTNNEGKSIAKSIKNK